MTKILVTGDPEGPWIEITDRFLGWHKELVAKNAQIDHINGLREDCGYIGAFITRAGGDWEQLAPGLGKDFPGDLPPLRQYIEDGSVEAYLKPRRDLAMLMEKKTQLEILEHITKLVAEITQGEP